MGNDVCDEMMQDWMGEVGSKGYTVREGVVIERWMGKRM